MPRGEGKADTRIRAGSHSWGFIVHINTSQMFSDLNKNLVTDTVNMFSLEGQSTKLDPAAVETI